MTLILHVPAIGSTTQRHFLYVVNFPVTGDCRNSGMELSKSQLTEWYTERALEIETFSRMVDHALELTRLGIERGVQVEI